MRLNDWRVQPRMRLALSASVGIMTGVLVWIHVRRVEATVQRHFVTEKVLVASRYISPGKPILPDYFEEVMVPSAGIQPSAIRTLQEWEQGRRAPSGAARTLILIAAKNPATLAEVA